MSLEPKKLKLGKVPFEVYQSTIPEGKTILITHSGKFHADETLSCAMLSFLPSYQTNTAIVRVNHYEVEEKMKNAEIVMDICGKYDPEKQLFDHHQKEFFETFSDDFKTKMASCGLIWKHFGKEVISIIAKSQNISVSENIVNKLHVKFYENFVEHVDANDNGIAVAENPRFKINSSFPHRVGSLNPQWNETENVNINDRFMKAIALGREEILENLNYYLFHWLPAREIIERSYSKRLLSGSCMELEEFCPWRAHVYDLEEERNEEELLFVIFQDARDSSWRYVIVGVKDSMTFELRIQPKSDWCGLRGEELSKKMGIESCTFIHASGFTGGNQTKEGVLRMLELIKKTN